MTPGLFVAAVRIYGPFLMRKLMPRVNLLGRVQTEAPNGSYRITELHVDPKYRGLGIGMAMLRYAEQVARSEGHSAMALQTWTTNPAKNLYERYGLDVIDTRTDEEFERITGAAGTYLMVKKLG